MLGLGAGDFCGLDFGADPLERGGCFAGDLAGDFLGAPLFGVGGFDLCFGFFGVSCVDMPV